MKYTKEMLTPIIKESITWADACRKLSIKPLSGSQTYLKKVAVKYDIDYSHFIGKSFNKGKKLPPPMNALKYCFNGSNIGSHKLKSYLIRDGYKENKCEICGISEWNRYKLSLELDHIDSNHFNNEFNNLQIICPNCHTVETAKRRELRPKTKRKKYIRCKNTNGKKIKIGRFHLRKIQNRPDKNTLFNLIWSKPLSLIGEDYKVSDSAIKKWCKKYKLNTPPRGYWAKFKVGLVNECNEIKNKLTTGVAQLVE